LSLPVENIPLFTERLTSDSGNLWVVAMTSVVGRLGVLSDLGKDLFRELKLLEPCETLFQNC